MDGILSGLNPAQLKAVTHDPKIPLQILAGPGSGKTKVLTSRIVQLILSHSLPPQSICAVTFTNKAANEMRERLKKLLGPDITSQIRMGTFHSLCVMFLRRYAKLVGLNGDFTICDSDDSKKVMIKLLKNHKPVLQGKGIALKEEAVLSFISKAKAKGLSPNDIKSHLLAEANAKKPNKMGKQSMISFIDEVQIELYREYEDALMTNNCLDFDDLLVFGVRLFQYHPKVRTWCKHILVDEFQDTNTMQYNLMRYIASANRCLTIVGDPDQSIYGWRSAEVENLARMQKDFPSTVQILLEHNYRSTGAILEVSAAIIAQDASRIPKTLQTQHAPGPIPCLQSFSSSYGEADFIAQEIKKLVADTGGMLEWKDFVVLLRYNSLSRTIESALQKQGIPNRVLAGHKFFERAEVKDVLSYLQVIDNPQFIPAFSRAVNIPSRGIGDKSISEILSRAASLNKSPLEVVEGIYEGRMADIKPSVKRKLKSFVEPVQELRTLANDGESPSSLIRRLLELIHYQAHLKKTQPDADSRWDNVQELITFARESEANGSCNQVLTKHDGDQEWDDQREDFDHAAFEEDGIVEVAGTDDAPSEPETPLRLFLQASMLSTDVQTQDGQASNNKVTISTCHTAKGLEWPVVFLPAVETGTFPSARAEDVEEERRLLYVACTRAQGLLYFSYANSRMVSGETKDQEISEFLRAVRTTKARLFSDLPPQLTREDRALLATVLHRPVPDEAGVARRRNEYHISVQQAQQTRWNNHGSTSSYTNQSSYPPSYNDTAPTLDPSSSFQPTFASVRTMQFSAGPSSTAPRVPLSPSRPSVLNTVPTQMVSSKPHSAGRKPVPSQAIAPSPVSRQAPLTSFLKPSSSTLQPPGQTIIPPVTKVSAPPLSSATSNAESQPAIIPPKTNGVKRRLGMGGGTSGYSNKKYKPPT